MARRPHKSHENQGRHLGALASPATPAIAEVVCLGGVEMPDLCLRDATESAASLRDTMLEINRNAQRRGLTPDILQSILANE